LISKILILQAAGLHVHYRHVSREWLSKLFDKQDINTASCRTVRALQTREQRMAKQAIDTACRMIAHSLQTREQRIDK